jgi:hypothetical protein
MRTELEPYLGHYIYLHGTVTTWHDGVHRSGPTSDPETLDVKDVCLTNVKWSWFDLDATGRENYDNFFEHPNRTDHLWLRVLPEMMRDKTLLSKQALIGYVRPYKRKDGSEDIGVMTSTILKCGDAMDLVTKHVNGGSPGQAYEIVSHMVQSAKDGFGLLVAPNASHNKIFADCTKLQKTLKTALQRQRGKSDKAKRKTKPKLAKGFA